MTPGPARPMVTVLPRNRPTPIALPIAIMVIWRGTSLRRSPSSLRSDADSAESVMYRIRLGSDLPTTPAAKPALLRKSRGSAKTTIVGAPGLRSTQKFDGLPDATAMYCRPPAA